MNIPWTKPYIGKKEWSAVKKCLESGWLSMGKKVSELEFVLSGITDSKYAIAVNSGTAALDIALKLIGIGPGDEVIIPALAYIATGNSVLYQRATPVFADVDPDTYTISAENTAKKITSRTKAVIAIDYAGQAADYDQLRRIIGKRRIFIIEDGAPGLGGKYKGRPLCALGDIGITSFHTAKVFTTIEGGMVFTDSKEWDHQARIMRSQGEDLHKKYHHSVLGHNYRMTDLHAAIGLAQLKRFNAVLKERKRIAKRYNDAFKGIEKIRLPQLKKDNEHSWFLYPVLLPARDKVALNLKKRGIATNISWPMPIYEQKMFFGFYKRPCPIAKDFTKRVLCLPIYYGLRSDEQDFVIDAIIREVKKI